MPKKSSWPRKVLNNIGKIGLIIQGKKAAQSPLVPLGHGVIMVYNFFFLACFLNTKPEQELYLKTHTIFTGPFTYHCITGSH